jgi:hypothetical protein
LIDYSIFKSRRFISAVVTIIVMVLVAVVPQLEPLESTVVDTLVALAEIIL